MTEKLTINSGKSQQIEFDISISGMVTEAPRVRFVITNVFEGKLAFDCVRSIDDRKKWSVQLPVLECLSEKDAAHHYEIQVIADEYYFEPITGLVEVVKTVKGDVVVESVEIEGKKTLMETPSNEEAVNETTGEKIKRPSSKSKKTAPEVETVAESFTASDAIDKAIAETIGHVKKPVKKGFLMNRKTKAVDPEMQALKEANSKKVNDILADNA